MELRQVRYFVKVVELGSMGRAPAELGLVSPCERASMLLDKLRHFMPVHICQQDVSGGVRELLLHAGGSRVPVGGPGQQTFWLSQRKRPANPS